MARVRWNTATLPRYIDSMWSNTEDWQEIRKSPILVSVFAEMGESIVRELNWELHAAQAARKQKVEDGYKFSISHDRDRIRMRIWTFTARAMAHEAKHQSILKHMRFVGDTRAHDGGFRKMGGDSFKGGRRKKRDAGSSRKGSTGSKGRTSGSSSRGRSSGARATRPRPSRPRMDPAKEARMRRQLAAMDLLATDKGATEGERSLAAERARRFRTELGE